MMSRAIKRGFGAGVFAAASLAQMAIAEMRYENGSGGSTLLYGQFNPAYLQFDDGVSTTGAVVDNVHSNSRVGLLLTQPFGSNTLTFNIETALGLRPSSQLSQNHTPKGINWSRSFIRKVDFSWRTQNAGTFSFGQGSMATDGAAEVDMSGTTLVNYVSVPDTAAAFRFRTSAGALSTKTIAGSFSDFDGGRRLRVRYDTPTFNGFTVSASYGEEVVSKNADFTATSIALRYNGEFGDVKVKGAIGYSEAKLAAGVRRNDTIGSLSLLHSSGFNVTVAAGDRKQSGNYYYGKLGYQHDWFSVGKTALSIDYYRGNDRSSVGAKSTSYSVGIVQSFDDARIEAYLGLTKYELTETSASYLDASSVLFGMRWKY